MGGRTNLRVTGIARAALESRQTGRHQRQHPLWQHPKVATAGARVECHPVERAPIPCTPPRREPSRSVSRSHQCAASRRCRVAPRTRTATNPDTGCPVAPAGKNLAESNAEFSALPAARDSVLAGANRTGIADDPRHRQLLLLLASWPLLHLRLRDRIRAQTIEHL